MSQGGDQTAKLLSKGEARRYYAKLLSEDCIEIRAAHY